MLSQNAEAYTTRDILVGYQAAFNHTIGDILWTPIVADYHPRRHILFHFPKQPLLGVRVVQTAGGKPVDWTVNELYVLNGPDEVRRTSAWKLQARPNPWDVEMAFDRNLATRWRSWQSLFPGMFVEADFGKPEPADAVRLECALGQDGVRLKLEGRTEAGEWKTLGAQPENVVVDDPPGLRRAAVAAMLARRVQWILLDDSDYGAEDLKTKTSEWGITCVADRGAARLYRLY